MEQTRSFTAERETSPESRLTVSLVSPICRRKEMPWKDSLELVGLGAFTLPLERRLESVEDGLGDGGGPGGAAGAT